MLLKKHLQSIDSFPNVRETVKNFIVSISSDTNVWERFNKLHGLLLQYIEKSEQPFVLKAVLHFMEVCEELKVISDYRIKHFERWLIDQRDIDSERKNSIRGKITGMYLPRDAYQVFFPIANQKSFEGPHFVLAHRSPDLDTVIASFWGWMDALGAGVGKKVHLWNVPPQMSCHNFEINAFFHEPFKSDIFSRIASRDLVPLVTGFDLMSTSDMQLRQLKNVSYGFHEEREEIVNVVVDDRGVFQADWRGIDVENVRQMINYLMILLRSREHDIYETLIDAFESKEIDVLKLNNQLKFLIDETLLSQSVLSQMTLKQQIFFNRFLEKVLGLKQGLGASFYEFFKAMDEHGISEFTTLLPRLQLDPNFGELSRDKLFSFVKDIVHGLRKNVKRLAMHIDTLKVATDIKRDVFEHLPHSVDIDSELGVIKALMGSYPSLTLHMSDEKGEKIPVGVIHQHVVNKPTVGTVSLRDFSDESDYVPSALDVVSIVDHHKSKYTTSIPAVAQVSDVQSTAVILAEVKMEIYDKYGTSGYEVSSIREQITQLRDDTSLSSLRRIERLLKKQAHLESGSSFYVSPQREALEYTHYIFAILDDTDLLTKVTYRDVICVKNLLNRLASLENKKEEEIVNFDDLNQEETFVNEAASRLLSSEFLYKIYGKNQKRKEGIIQEQILRFCEEGDDSLLKDTKIMSGYASVGQSKVFSGTVSTIESHQSILLKKWVEWCRKKYENRSEVNLYMQMISTIPDAERVYKQIKEPYSHKDSLLIWIPDSDSGWSHAECFFRQFTEQVERLQGVTIEIFGKKSDKLQEILPTIYPSIKINRNKGIEETVVVFNFRAAMLNSRKAMIAPYL